MLTESHHDGKNAIRIPGAKKKEDPNQHIHLLLETLTGTNTDSLPHSTLHLGPAEPEELLESQAN